MNRLDLVRRLIYESGASGVALGTTLNQRGDALNFVNWIDDAWLEVHALHNWPSTWELSQITVKAGSSTAAQSVAHPRYEKKTAKIGGVSLYYSAWADFREDFPEITAGTPSAWSIRPDRSIALNAIVAADTVMTVERYRVASRPAADTDVPMLFDEHHMMIVWRALMLYGGFDEAGVVYKRGASEYALMKRLAAADLPSLEQGEPLL